MIISIDGNAVVPPYEQIRSQITLMAGGDLLPIGSRLPTIRQLAADLDLAPGTIARAYRELEQQGLIESSGRRGTFVTRAAPLDANQRRARLDDEALRFAQLVRQLGAVPDEALAAVRRALRSH